jgi:hypothetical protein
MKEVTMQKKTRLWLIIFLAVLVLIQFIPVDRSNPVVSSEFELKAPEDVKIIFKNSCYDCHSYDTKWPFYSYIAPVSWLISGDVTEGRDHINFSIWEQYSMRSKNNRKAGIWEEVSKDEMPLPIYVFMHNNSKLNDQQKQILKEWSQSQ